MHATSPGRSLERRARESPAGPRGHRSAVLGGSPWGAAIRAASACGPGSRRSETTVRWVRPIAAPRLRSSRAAACSPGTSRRSWDSRSRDRRRKDPQAVRARTRTLL